MSETKESLKTENDIDDEGEVLQKTYEFKPTGHCRYRQQGPYLVCVNCEIQHADYIGMERIMVGEDEQGLPILKLRTKV